MKKKVTPLYRRVRKSLIILSAILILVSVFDGGFFIGRKSVVVNPDEVYLIPKQVLVIKPICEPNQVVAVEEILADDKQPAIQLRCIDRQKLPQQPQQKGWGIPK